MRFLELRIPPLFVTATFAAAMWGAHVALPGGTYRLPGVRVLALASVVVGVGVSLAGVAAFRRHGVTVNPLAPDATRSVVTDGIYRHTRNPMYLGFALILGGWAAYLSNVAAAACLPVFVLYVDRFQIRPEERKLLEQFGPSFRAYRARVRRWI
jgi:protein-S-isoprenylcysteine O-methyltransferase Ste14